VLPMCWRSSANCDRKWQSSLAENPEGELESRLCYARLTRRCRAIIGDMRTARPTTEELSSWSARSEHAEFAAGPSFPAPVQSKPFVGPQ
jgi:hypothetical protein